MTRRDLPTRIPCAVCLVPVDGWAGDDDPEAVPCGHRLSDINREGEQMVPVEFGQYVESEAA